MSIKKTKLRKTIDQMKAKGLDREAIVEKVYPKAIKRPSFVNGQLTEILISRPAGKKFSRRVEALLPKK
jgi:hypothetical protein